MRLYHCASTEERINELEMAIRSIGIATLTGNPYNHEATDDGEAVLPKRKGVTVKNGKVTRQYAKPFEKDGMWYLPHIDKQRKS